MTIDKNHSRFRPLGRRELLRRSLLVAVGAAVAPLARTAPARAAPATPPSPTPAVRAAFAGGGASETLNPFFGATPLDFVRARATHAPLGNLAPDAPDGVAYGVLEGIDIADDLSVYTLRIRPGIEFSDGSPLVAVDVLYSLRFAAREATGSYAAFVADFDLDGAIASDDLTIALPTLQAVADGRTLLCLGTNFDEGLAWIADHPMDGARAYNLSKEAVIVWTMDTCLRHRDRRIRINSVSPGPVDTAILDDFRTSMGHHQIQGAIDVVGRAGTPADIAPAIVWLASRAAPWVNGVNLATDGGLLAAATAAGWPTT